MHPQLGNVLIGLKARTALANTNEEPLLLLGYLRVVSYSDYGGYSDR